MQVHIDGALVVECSHILPERWNGWAQPVFTHSEMIQVGLECVRLGWVSSLDEMSCEWYELSVNEWVTSGWVWQEVKGGE